MTSPAEERPFSSYPTADATIVSVSLSGGYLGGAVYDQSQTTIRLLSDVLEDQEFSMSASLLQQEQPTTILVNKNQDNCFLRFLSQFCRIRTSVDEMYLDTSIDFNSSTSIPRTSCALSTTIPTDLGQGAVASPENAVSNEGCGVAGANNDVEDSEEGVQPRTLILLANHIYNFDSCFKRISDLFAEERFSGAESKLAARFRIDLFSRNMVRALGALLMYLDSARVGVEYETANVRTPVTTIKTILIGEMVEIDKSTYRALNIFSADEYKGGLFRNTSKSSECRSLFSLCNRCRSTPGKHMLKQWFQHPTTNREVLIQRQQAISFFLQDCNVELTGKIHNLLEPLRNVRHILERLRSGTAKVVHWENLHKTISNSVIIGRYLESVGSPLTLLQNDIHCYGEPLAELCAVLSAMIDFEESYAENRLVMNTSVDPELDRVKSIYRQLPSILTGVAQDEASRFQAATCSVAYVPMIGYLVVLPHDFHPEEFPDLEVIYTTAHTMHAKSERMRALDEELGDLKMRIIDKETTITLRMSALILSRSSLLLAVERAGALLDAAIALALTARQFGWNCPKIVDEPVIDASRVTHPLSQLVVEHFVANPVSSGGGCSRIKIVTGPNACGKSIYLKQVGLLVFLAHIGSFVPADVAHIGFVNRIFSRIYAVDSVLDGMSTFAKDLSQISLALRRGDERSLIIIDEFGKGAMTEVGLSLLASSLSYWASKGEECCPHIFLSSHFHALPELITDERGIVSYHTMEVFRKRDKLNFQFRFVDGLVDSSFASYTALKMGIQEDVVDRANEVYKHICGKHALLELSSIDSKEERKNGLLTQGMLKILSLFGEWNIIGDLEGLLGLLEETLLLHNEGIELFFSHYLSEHEDRACVNDGELRENQVDLKWDYTVLHLRRETTMLPGKEKSALNEELSGSSHTLLSALRSEGRKTDRSNLSVSFATDMAEEENTSRATAITVPQKAVGDQTRHSWVLLRSDNELQLRAVTVDNCFGEKPFVPFVNEEQLIQKRADGYTKGQLVRAASKHPLLLPHSNEAVLRKRTRTL
ncbi:hypothetical protein RB195_021034 [Necator americanus]|uniref:MutS domain V protein n=1 Tax=Necator americanus TaxID=51031 RepID=A0ABR1CLV7_NECAM